MGNIIQIKGSVKYSITLDPSVWIFDDRKIDLNTYFELASEDKPDELSQYKKNISKQWDREITEGAAIPKVDPSKRKFEKEKLLTGSFGIPMKPFLKNTEPDKEAHSLIILTNDQEVEIPLEEAYNLIFGFSINGKPLTQDGPVHIYYGDGSNKNTPIKNVNGLRVI
ncbi:MAG: hypothetical protein K0S25_172 [Bacillus sp. (in: firmicutes)]|nr:hypothetical protein [Bacillus sp. (in: firmicutes)]